VQVGERAADDDWTLGVGQEKLGGGSCCDSNRTECDVLLPAGEVYPFARINNYISLFK
jgi:hypothetical protein